MARPYLAHRWTALAVAAVVGLLVLAYVVTPNWASQYGAWLAIFTVWMVWFVVVARRWIDDADF